MLSIIIQSTGSETLYYTMLSVKDQLRPMDEVIVVSAVPDKPARHLYLNTFGLRGGGYYEGEAPLALGTRKASGMWLIYLDDASLLTPKALDTIRDGAQREQMEQKPRPLLFNTRYTDGIVIKDVLIPFNQRFTDGVTTRIVQQGTPVQYDSIVRLRHVMRM